MTKSNQNKKGNLSSESKNKSIQDVNAEDFINTSFGHISSLTYEDSLKELELIVKKLQSDDLKVDELQRYYIEGNLYFKHCEKLLDKVEQDVLEVDEDKLKELNDK